MTTRRVLLIFVDGVGLAPGSQTNPWATTSTPALGGLLDGDLVTETFESLAGTTRKAGGRAIVLGALDACLGVDGLPQSATGQTTLFTGVNASAALGRHVSAFPGPRLKAILDEHSLFRKLVEAGGSATFANPFTPGYFEQVEAGKRRHSATTLATLAGGLPLRDTVDLAEGRAVTWDIVGDLSAGYLPDPDSLGLPLDPVEAGRRLARLAGEHDLTLFETFLTDMAGHRRASSPEQAVERVDGLLAGIVDSLDAQTTMVLTSDHGNLEAGDHRRHTRNPVPLLVVGSDAESFRSLNRLDQVAPRIFDRLRSRQDGVSGDAQAVFSSVEHCG